MSKYAVKLGFKTSWMEFLASNKNCYLRHPVTNNYNPNFIVTLTRNYRSHPDILNIPSKLFYDGLLLAKGRTGKFKKIIKLHIVFLIKYANNFPFFSQLILITSLEVRFSQTPNVQSCLIALKVSLKEVDRAVITRKRLPPLSIGSVKYWIIILKYFRKTLVLLRLMQNNAN